jgi:hypothetical protein
MMWPLIWQRRGLVRPGFERCACILGILAKLETGRNGPRRNIAVATEF